MVKKHILSTIFLVFISTNVIQGSIIGGLFHFLPNFGKLVDFPRISEFTRNFASSATAAAKDALGRFENSFGNGLDENIISTKPALFSRLISRGRQLLPKLENSPLLLGPNNNGASSATSTAADAAKR